MNISTKHLITETGELIGQDGRIRFIRPPSGRDLAALEARKPPKPAMTKQALLARCRRQRRKTLHIH
jgi:hypothetical protein